MKNEYEKNESGENSLREFVNLLHPTSRVVGMLDLRSVGHEFESWPFRSRVQPWASC